MSAKKMLVIDYLETESHKKILIEFELESHLNIEYLQKTKLMSIPAGYDIYLLNTLDVDADAIWKLKTQQPKSKIYGINGGFMRKGISLESNTITSMRAVFGRMQRDLAELIYADATNVDKNRSQK